jgi:hypothetical protein
MEKKLIRKPKLLKKRKKAAFVDNTLGQNVKNEDRNSALIDVLSGEKVKYFKTLSDILIF